MKLIKGDTKTIIFATNETITGWELRCEIWDKSGKSVKLATENSGGSDDQIKILNSNQFAIYIPSGSTTNFEDRGFIEIEANTGETVGGEPEVLTILPKEEVIFIDEKIKWTTP